jgi:hypothetical protein
MKFLNILSLVSSVASSTLLAQTFDPSTVYGLSTGSGNIKVSASLDGKTISGVTESPSISSMATSVSVQDTSSANQQPTASNSPATTIPEYAPGQSSDAKAVLSSGSESVADTTDYIKRSVADNDYNTGLLKATSTAVAQHAASITSLLDANGKEFKKTMDEISSTEQQLASVGNGDGSQNAAAAQRAALQAKLNTLNQKKDNLSSSSQAAIIKNGQESKEAMAQTLDDPANG